MTTISPARRRRASLPAVWLQGPADVASAVVGALENLGERYRAFRALRQLESMPDHILKDIGWPARGTDRSA